MKTYTTVYMVRHGETDANVTDMIQGQSDVPLNSDGLKQAELAGQRFKGIRFDAVYSSDLSRALVTARSIAGTDEIILTPALREWHLGHWQGRCIADIAVEFPQEYAAFKANSSDFRPAGGESIRELCDRSASFLKQIAIEQAGKKVLCVTHGGFLRATLLNVMDMAKYPERARVDNTSISCIRTCDGGNTWQLVFWNDTNHLEGHYRNSSGW